MVFPHFHLFPFFHRIIARAPRTLNAGGDNVRLYTLMGFGVGMAATIIAAKAATADSVKSRGKAIKKKIVRLLD